MKVVNYVLLITTIFLLTKGQNTSADENFTNKEIITSNNAFGIDLYHQLASGSNENLFFSPYSINNVLTMTVEGARNETALEMGKVLRFPVSLYEEDSAGHIGRWDLSDTFQGLNVLNQWLTGVRDSAPFDINESGKNNDVKNSSEEVRWGEPSEIFEAYGPQGAKGDPDSTHSADEKKDERQFLISNALWVEQTYPLSKPYADTINTFCGFDCIFQLDFKAKQEQARQQINDWVEDKTNNRITDSIPQDTLNQRTSLVLTNTLYFRDKWLYEFDERFTRERDFTLSNGIEVRTQLMEDSAKSCKYAAFNGDGSFFNTPYKIRRGQVKGLYPDKDGFSMIELSYKNRELGMVVITPNSASNFEAIEQKLSLKNLNQWLGNKVIRDVSVTMPKFKLEESYNLNDTLKDMGMKRAFLEPGESGGAQFWGMTSSEELHNQLYISDILHKTNIEVNEKETEASAATVVFMGIFGAAPSSEEITFIPEFKADRPFIFLIRDMTTGAIIFIGRILKPDSSAAESSTSGAPSLKSRESNSAVLKPTPVPPPVRP